MQFLKMLIAAVFFMSTAANAQTPFLTRDINTTFLNGYPTAFGYLYFNGTNVSSGTELWRSDGTTGEFRSKKFVLQ